jgi:Sister chromatid cohesion C-terminus
MTKERKNTDMLQLLGNASEMAELRYVYLNDQRHSLEAPIHDDPFCSVSSSLMQRYLERILQTALDPNVQLRNLSFKVITRIIQQGLAHPVIVSGYN